MNQTWKILIVVVLIVAIIGVISVKRNQSGRQTDGTSVPSSGKTAAGQVPTEYKIANLTGKGMPVLVDIGADTCIPCKLMAPILKELKEELQGKITVQFLNLNECHAFADEYKISVMPTQIFYDASGKERFRHKGFYAKDEIYTKLKELKLLTPDEPFTKGELQ